MSRLLDVKNLKTYFHSEYGSVKAVDDVSFYVNEGETLGIVGESGCGKSVSCMSIVRLIETPPGKYEGGEIWFGEEGRREDMLKISDARMRQIRGNDISLIFQEPMTSLNPIFRIGDQISEALILHQHMTKEEARKASIDMLERVRIPNPERVVDDYPFALSGGMRQRAMIAMALACRPRLLIADEPTTALDVTIQAQILELMLALKRDTNMSILLITHDLGVVAEFSERVAVMYLGQVVETAPTAALFARPSHPYTRGLLESLPRMDAIRDRFVTIPGAIPDPSESPSGCKFNNRCRHAEDRCRTEAPPIRRVDGEHWYRCWREEA